METSLRKSPRFIEKYALPVWFGLTIMSCVSFVLVPWLIRYFDFHFWFFGYFLVVPLLCFLAMLYVSRYVNKRLHIMIFTPYILIILYSYYAY